MSIVEHAWSLSLDDIFDELSINPNEGLSSVEVSKRQRQFGKNQLMESKKKSVWEILLDQMKSIIMGLLVSAAIVSFLFGEITQSIAIIAVIFITILIGFFTEFRAIRSMESLRQMSRVTTIVLREGKRNEVSAEDLVPGDVVLFEGGDIISADLRLIEANKLQIDESALTGESVPVSKSVDQISEDTSLEERENMVFKGTLVTRGSGTGIVISTGLDTQLGKISSLVEEAEEEITPLEQRLKYLGRTLVWVTLLITAIVGALGIVRGKDILLMVETAIALAVAAIPEGLPIVATVALAQGMLQMVKRNALINRLSSVETLGSTNVLFTDKTGTLTINKMTVKSVETPSSSIRIDSDAEKKDKFLEDDTSISLEDHKVLMEIIRIGVLCNNASLEAEDDQHKNLGDPLEIALLDLGKKAGINRSDTLKDMAEVREEAFDPEIKMMATVHKKDKSFIVAVKGAPEEIIEKCETITDNGKKKEFTNSLKEDWFEKNEQMADDGYRVLGLAMKHADTEKTDVYEHMTFLGLFGLVDPPRDDIKSYIDDCQHAGINIIMVTGDHPSTALNVAKDVSLVDDETTDVMLGKDLQPYDELSKDLQEQMMNTKIFARVSPKQKLDLISIHQHNNSVVAMIGDGVNDAPALKKADIGIAMGKKGTQVAQDASDMILTDDSFSSIVAAIRHGRIIFSNIRKFIIFLLSGNIGEIAAVAIASLGNVPLPILPLQILYVNLILDVFPALALGVGQSNPGVMDKPPRDPQEPFLMNKHWFLIVAYGLIIGGAMLGSLLLALFVFDMPVNQSITISFLTLTFARLGHVFNMRDVNTTLLNNEVTRNRYVWGAIVLCTTLILAAIYLPGLSGVLQTVTPGFNGWLIIGFMSMIPFIIGQLGLFIANLKN